MKQIFALGGDGGISAVIGVSFNEWAVNSGQKIAVISLHRPERRNSQTLAMVDAIHRQLDQWLADSGVVALWLEGSGDHFCAGGDVIALATHCQQPRSGRFAAPVVDFFSGEYRLVHRIRHCPLPVIAWGDGAVMGGGLGLFAAASHRLVSQRAMLAMPEARIGLFPDVAATRFLLPVADGGGLFLAMTGAVFGASDALLLGLADLAVDHEQRRALIAALGQRQWRPEGRQAPQLSQWLTQWRHPLRDEPWLARHLPAMQALATSATAAEDYCQRLFAIRAEDHWWQQAQQRCAAASPLAQALIWQQRRYAHLDWAEIARRELDWAVQLCHFGDFVEGVSALLLDKGRAAHWRYTPATATTAVQPLMESPWPAASHPLAAIRG